MKIHTIAHTLAIFYTENLMRKIDRVKNLSVLKNVFLFYFLNFSNEIVPNKTFQFTI